MKESMYKTFSSKYESTVRKIVNKYCKDKIFTVRYQNKKVNGWNVPYIMVDLG